MHSRKAEWFLSAYAGMTALIIRRYGVGGQHSMQMQARVLVGSLREVKTKKGANLPKTSLKVLDLGPECGSDVTTYWIDFLGDAALSQVELDSIVGDEFMIDVRFCRASESKGKAFLNISGGAISTTDGRIVQTALNEHHMKRAG